MGQQKVVEGGNQASVSRPSLGCSTRYEKRAWCAEPEFIGESKGGVYLLVLFAQRARSAPPIAGKLMRALLIGLLVGRHNPHAGVNVLSVRRLHLSGRSRQPD